MKGKLLNIGILMILFSMFLGLSSAQSISTGNATINFNGTITAPIGGNLTSQILYLNVGVSDGVSTYNYNGTLNNPAGLSSTYAYIYSPQEQASAYVYNIKQTSANSILHTVSYNASISFFGMYYSEGMGTLTWTDTFTSNTSIKTSGTAYLTTVIEIHPFKLKTELNNLQNKTNNTTALFIALQNTTNNTINNFNNTLTNMSKKLNTSLTSIASISTTQSGLKTINTGLQSKINKLKSDIKTNDTSLSNQINLFEVSLSTQSNKTASDINNILFIHNLTATKVTNNQKQSNTDFGIALLIGFIGIAIGIFSLYKTIRKPPRTKEDETKEYIKTKSIVKSEEEDKKKEDNTKAKELNEYKKDTESKKDIIALKEKLKKDKVYQKLEKKFKYAKITAKENNIKSINLPEFKAISNYMKEHYGLDLEDNY